MDEETFIRTISQLLGDVGLDYKKPDRIPVSRAEREKRNLLKLAEACGAKITNEDANNILGWA